MHKVANIFTLAYKQPLLQEDLVLLQEVERHVPGSVRYAIKRYRKQPQWNIEDTGMLVYHLEKIILLPITWS
jgi:hypothetical protein